MPDRLFTRLMFGVAAAIGAPLFYMTFASTLFWRTYAALGLPSGNRVHPILAGSGLILMGLGLYGTYRKLPASNLGRLGLFVAEVGAIFGVVAMIFWEKQIGETFLPIALALHPIGLLLMGVVALRNRSLGRLSFVPLTSVIIYAAFVLYTTTGYSEVDDTGWSVLLALLCAGWVLLGAAITTPAAEEPSGPMLAA